MFFETLIFIFFIQFNQLYKKIISIILEDFARDTSI